MKLNRALCYALVAAALPLLPAYSQTAAPAAAPAAAAAAVPASYPPSTAEVVKLAQSGVGDDVVVAYVKSAPNPYTLSANDIVALKNAGISSAVISAMLNHDHALRSQPAPVVASASAAVATVSPAGTYEQRLYAPAAGTTAIPNSPTLPAAATVPPAPAMATASPAPAVAAQPAPPTAIVEQTPPAAQVEVVPVAPGPDYYWVPGYWTWHGTWIWVGGRYAYRPWHGAVYVGGNWARHGRGYIWVGGHWR